MWKTGNETDTLSFDGFQCHIIRLLALKTGKRLFDELRWESSSVQQQEESEDRPNEQKCIWMKKSVS